MPNKQIEKLLFSTAILVLISLMMLWAGHAFAQVLTAKVAISPEPPSITSLVAADPNNSGAGFSSGDTITVRFSDPTNREGGNGVQTKDAVNDLFSFSSSLDGAYSGRWINPSTFVITIGSDVGTVVPQVGAFKVTVVGAIKNAAGTSESSTSESPVLEGSFGSPSGPFIIDFVVDDPDNSDPAYSSGDVFTIRFSEPTNRPGGTGAQLKPAVDNLFSFTNSLGNDHDAYTGQWINPKTFKITVSSVNNGNPKIGVTTVEPAGTTPIKNPAGTSLASIGKSSPLSGSFGRFSVTKDVGSGSILVATLPSGTSSSVKLPSGTSGQVTIQKSETSSNTVSGGTVEFIGNIVDISVGGGASCQNGCEISFSFSSADLPSGKDPLSVKIFHDANNDGDFADSGEQLSTSVVEQFSDLYVATATITSTSNLGVGFVTPTPSQPTPSTPSTTSSGHGGGGRSGLSVGGPSPGPSGGATGGIGGKIKPENKESPFFPKETIELEAASFPKNPNIPNWVRNVASWWSQGILSEKYFVLGVSYMVDEKIIEVHPPEKKVPQAKTAPQWTKNVASWWSQGKISDDDFIKYAGWLVEHGLLPLE